MGLTAVYHIFTDCWELFEIVEGTNKFKINILWVNNDRIVDILNILKLKEIIVKNFRKFSALVCSLTLASVALTGCNMSDDTKDAGKTAICAVGKGSIATIRTNDSAAKFIANLVKDNSEGDIKKIAEKVAKGTATAEATNELADYVENLCK